ncbi:Transcriptional regulatory protein WalR [uncultured bacterium]|nr:Transcriptional regulatory protein WalR [uncultured bacterium]
MADGFFKILVVDDDETMREVCSEVLAAEGYDVSIAADGWEALGVMGLRWDLIITDFNMPGLDGVGLYRATVSRIPEMSGKFIFMTGDSASAKVIEGMGRTLVRKPFKVRDLLDKVSAALKESDASRRDRRVRLSGCGLHIRMAGSELAAVAEDLSIHGMKIRYAGSPFEAGPGLRISIDDLNISRNARVVWSVASAGSESCSGVIFEKPVPASVLAELVPSRL